MTKIEAQTVLETYINGWVTRDKDKILASLTEDALIREAHGLTHKNLFVITKWLEGWLATGSTMDYWDIESFHFDPLTQSAFFLWEFASTYEGKKEKSTGASFVVFRDKKISVIQGYQDLT